MAKLRAPGELAFREAYGLAEERYNQDIELYHKIAIHRPGIPVFLYFIGHKGR